MSEERSVSTSTNFGWVGFLGVILVVLKLNPGGYLDSRVEEWSWWLVLLPFWGGIALVLLALLIGAIGVLVVSAVQSVKRKRKAKARREELRARFNRK